MLALIHNTRNIGDFSQWEEHKAYQKAFKRLLRDLKTTNDETHGEDNNNVDAIQTHDED